MNLSKRIFILQDFNSLIFRNKNDLSNQVNMFGLEKRQKRSQIISYDICFIQTVLQYLFLIVWSKLIKINDDVCCRHY
jgi:hypothetical protein